MSSHLSSDKSRRAVPVSRSSWPVGKRTPNGATLGRRVAGTLCAGVLLGFSWLAQAQDLTLGVIAGISGSGASYGAGIAQGAEMAVREINATGGINGRQLKLKVVDDASDPARSAIAMRRLLSSSPDLIVGGWGSAQVLAHMELAEQSATPYIVVGATNPTITTPRNKWVFRVIPSDSVMAEQLANIVIGTLGMKRIAVFNDSNSYGSGNRDVFVATLARHGLKPVQVQAYDSRSTDFRVQLTDVKKINPDAIAIFGTLPAAPIIMTQARELGIQSRFIGTGGLANEALIEAAPSAAEGTLLMSFFNEQADKQALNWSRRYQLAFADRRFRSPVLAAWEYRAIKDIVAPCLRSAGRDRLKLRDCIANWRGRPFGVGAEVYFDKSGQLVQPGLAVEISGGVFRPVGSKR